MSRYDEVRQVGGMGHGGIERCEVVFLIQHPYVVGALEYLHHGEAHRHYSMPDSYIKIASNRRRVTMETLLPKPLGCVIYLPSQTS